MIQNPTMDPAKFARQFARIRERDAERALRAKLAGARPMLAAWDMSKEEKRRAAVVQDGADARRSK